MRALTELVLTRRRDVTRFEGHTREGNLTKRSTFRRAGWVKEAFYRNRWRVDGAMPKSSLAYAVLRGDWESVMIMPVLWDDQ